MDELAELSDHPLVSRSLERHDELGQLVYVGPAPGHEFLRVASAGRMHDVDLAVSTGEPQREPLLLLPAVSAAPGTADQVRRDVVGQPVRDLAEFLDRA